MTSPVIMWFRRDLRHTDNTALNAAMRTGSPILPVFVFDPTILKGRLEVRRALASLMKALASLDAALRERGGRLAAGMVTHVEMLSRLVAE